MLILPIYRLKLRFFETDIENLISYLKFRINGLCKIDVIPLI
jgi:hypothetical protein